MQTKFAKVSKRSEYNLLPGVRLPLIIIIIIMGDNALGDNFARGCSGG